MTMEVRELRGNDAKRQRIEAWKLMRTLTPFSVEDIATGTEMAEAAARRLIRAMLDSGHVRVVAQRRIGEAGSYNLFELVTGQRMPSVIDARYYWQMQAWTAMRIHRRFTASSILRSMEAGLTTERTMRRWLKALERYDYVRQDGPTVPGRENWYQIVIDQAEAPIVRAAPVRRRREVSDD